MTTDQKSPHVQIEIVAADTLRIELRDYFAGQALARLVGLYDVDELTLPSERLDEFARLAYALADAMLRAREEHA